MQDINGNIVLYIGQPMMENVDGDDWKDTGKLTGTENTSTGKLIIQRYDGTFYSKPSKGYTVSNIPYNR